MSGADSAEVAALQAALQGEYAAVYGYGLAAGALQGPQLAQAQTYLDAHRAARDRVRSLLLDVPAVPVAGSPAYAVPPASTAGQARAVLAGIEDRLAAVYADLVAASTGASRALAVAALQDCAVRSAQWGAPVPVFPGLPERAVTPTPTGTSTPAGSPTP